MCVCVCVCMCVYGWMVGYRSDIFVFVAIPLLFHPWAKSERHTQKRTKKWTGRQRAENDKMREDAWKKKER